MEKSDLTRLDKVKLIKRSFLRQLKLYQEDYVEFFKACDYSEVDQNDIRLYVDFLHYSFILQDYLMSDWAFTQYSFMDEDYGITIYDISDAMIDYMYRDGMTALDILHAMRYKKPWYGPINDKFIDKYVLTTFHKLASEHMKGEIINEQV